MEQLQTFGFVSAYMAASFVAFLWFGMSFPVGMRRGPRAGARVLTSGLVAYVVALVVIFGWAVASGQWARFMSVLGPSVLIEMSVFVTLVLFVAYSMPAKYLSDRYQEELKPEAGDA